MIFQKMQATFKRKDTTIQQQSFDRLTLQKPTFEAGRPQQNNIHCSKGITVPVG